MNYEIARELKDNGFPQEGGEHLMSTENLKLPTLSELIEACGEEFLNLYKTGDVWTCTHPYEDNDDVSGKTPDIAVAKLWLELNK